LKRYMGKPREICISTHGSLCGVTGSMDCQAKVEVYKCRDLSRILELFDNHCDERFAYLADTQLFKVFSGLESAEIFEAKVNGATVGCVYAMRYMHRCGWLGGLLVHRKFRRKGIGRKLLEKALGWFDVTRVYAFVEPENIAARKLFESMGFNVLYRRLNFKIQASSAGMLNEDKGVDYEFRWSKLARTMGFEERGGVVNLGYYPLKLTEDLFDDLRSKGRVLRSGNAVAIVENSYVVDIDAYTFIFNDHILNKIRLPVRKEIVEVNPFYTKHDIDDLARLLRNLAHKDLMIWTYVGDHVATRLPLRGTLGALVFELCKNKQTSH